MHVKRRLESLEVIMDDKMRANVLLCKMTDVYRVLAWIKRMIAYETRTSNEARCTKKTSKDK